MRMDPPLDRDLVFNRRQPRNNMPVVPPLRGKGGRSHSFIDPYYEKPNALTDRGKSDIRGIGVTNTDHKRNLSNQ